MLSPACGDQTTPRDFHAHGRQLEPRGTADSILKSRSPYQPYLASFRKWVGVMRGCERTRARNQSTPSFGPPLLGPLHTVRPADQAKGVARKETQHSQQLLPGNA